MKGRPGQSALIGSSRNPCHSATTWLACLLLVLIGASSASDNYITPYSPVPGPPPTPEQARAVELRSVVDSANITSFPEAPGLKFGKLKFNPYMELEEIHTDNSRRTPTHELTDDIVTAQVGFNSVFKPLETLRTTLNYEFGWYDYLRGTLRDYQTQQANCELQLDRVGVEGMQLLFSDQYLLTGNSSALENEIVQFEKYQTNRTEMRATYRYNRFRITGAYSYSFLDYAAKDLSFGDVRTPGGLFEVAWHWIPNRMELFGSYQISRNLYDHDRTGDFDTNTYLAGVRGKYSRLNFTVGVGYVSSRPLFLVGTQGDVGFNAAVNYQPHQRITVEAVGSRGFQSGIRTGASLSTDFTTNFKLQLTRRGTFVASYLINDSDRFNGVRQTSQAYATRFEYKLYRRVQLMTGFTRYERTSTSKFDEFNIDEFKLNAKISW